MDFNLITSVNQKMDLKLDQLQGHFSPRQPQATARSQALHDPSQRTKIKAPQNGQVQYSFCFAMAFCATRYPNIARAPKSDKIDGAFWPSFSMLMLNQIS